MKTNAFVPYIFFPIFISAAVFGLFMLDHETRFFADLLSPQNLAAFVIYAIPSYLISLVMYKGIFKNQSLVNRIVASLSLGIIVGFTIVISVFVLIR